MVNIKMFISKNLVAIVMVPSLIGLHYGWNSMQHNTVLVTEEERKDLPIVIAVKVLLNHMKGKPESTQGKEQ